MEDPPARATAIPGDAPTVIDVPDVRARLAPARRDRDLHARERRDEESPGGLRRAFESLVERAETFVFLHLTTRRVGIAAVVAAAVGLATWISMATSGSTPTATGVMARRPEPMPEPALAPGSRGPSARRAASHGNFDTGGITAGDPRRVAGASGSTSDGAPGASEVGLPSSTSSSAGDAVALAQPEPGGAATARDGHPSHEGAPGTGAAGPAKSTRTAEKGTGRPPQTKDVIAALNDRQSALEDCIDRASEGGAPAWLGRRAHLFVMVEPSGRVSGADFEDEEISSTPLAACVRAVATAVSLREFEGSPVLIDVPLRLGSAR